jgi:hypothetical protein
MRSLWYVLRLRTEYHAQLVFRELLQNSDDARARSVEIRFETKQYLEEREHRKEMSNDNNVIDANGTEKPKLPNLKNTAVRPIIFSVCHTYAAEGA